MVFSAKRDIRMTYSQHFFCAGIAGITAKTLVAPLDVVKIRFQVGSPETKRGFFKAASLVYRTEGLKAFWKGNLVGCSRIVPYSMLQLLAFQKLRLSLADETGRLTSFTALLAGSGAGLFATSVLYPSDVIKTRLIIQNDPFKYNSISQSIKTIFREEGIRGFYKGMFTSFIGSVHYAATVFFLYEKLHRADWHAESTPSLIFLTGCLVTGIAQTISYPFDTVRKNLQANCTNFLHNQRVEKHDSTKMFDTFGSIVKKNNRSALWRGNLINLMKIIPYTSAMFFSYEIAKIYCLHANGYFVKPFRYRSYDDIDQSLKPGELEEFLTEIDVMEEMESLDAQID